MGTTTGTQGSTNCTGGFGNSGCTYKDNNANSYGAGFASGGGGVYVAELATEGIRVWFLTVSGRTQLELMQAIRRPQCYYGFSHQHRYQYSGYTCCFILELLLQCCLAVHTYVVRP